MFNKFETAKSVKGLEILAYTNQPGAASYTYILGGMHGDEGEGIFMVEQLHNWLQVEEPKIPIILIPLLNPDGLAAGTRVNANGVDLNRNWPVADWSPSFDETRYNPGSKPLSEPENKFLYSLFKRYKPQMILTFHSWNKEPTLNYNEHAKKDAEFLAQLNNYAISDDVGYATPGSLGTFATEVLQSGIITYECPVVTARLTLGEIWLQNEQALMQYFTKFVQSNFVQSNFVQ